MMDSLGRQRETTKGSIPGVKFYNVGECQVVLTRRSEAGKAINRISAYKDNMIFDYDITYESYKTRDERFEAFNQSKADKLIKMLYED